MRRIESFAIHLVQFTCPMIGVGCASKPPTREGTTTSAYTTTAVQNNELISVIMKWKIDPI